MTCKNFSTVHTISVRHILRGPRLSALSFWLAAILPPLHCTVRTMAAFVVVSLLWCIKQMHIVPLVPLVIIHLLHFVVVVVVVPL